MKGKIAQRWYYDRVEPVLEDAFEEFYRKTGRRYGFVEAYRCEDADYVIVGMGCYMETARATVDYLRDKGIDAGCLTVFVFRPFPARQIVSALRHCRAFTVLERMDDPAFDGGQPPDPRDQGGILRRHERPERPGTDRANTPRLQWRRRPGQPGRSAGRPDRRFREHDRRGPGLLLPGHRLIRLALKMSEDPDLRPPAGFSMRGHSVGGFGSVTTNKVIATIAGNVFGKDVQAYPKYGSEKKGLPTTYYLTIADSHINMHCELEQVDLLCINDPTAILSPLTLKGLVPGGAIFMQSPYTDPAEVWKRFPAENRRWIRDNNVRVYFCDMVKIAREVASEADLQMRMQGIVLLGAFLKLTPYIKDANMSDDQVYDGVEKALRKYFGKRGDRVVQDNLDCVKRGYSTMQAIPREIVETC